MQVIVDTGRFVTAIFDAPPARPEACDPCPIYHFQPMEEEPRRRAMASRTQTGDASEASWYRRRYNPSNSAVER
jgi:hypothetical protein